MRRSLFSSGGDGGAPSALRLAVREAGTDRAAEGTQSDSPQPLPAAACLRHSSCVLLPAVLSHEVRAERYNVLLTVPMWSLMRPAQIRSTGDAICLRGVCKRPWLQLETTSEAVRRGWSWSRKQCLPPWGARSQGTRDPGPMQSSRSSGQPGPSVCPSSGAVEGPDAVRRGGFGSSGVGRLVGNSIRLTVAGACCSQAAANVTNHCSKSASSRPERGECWLESEKRTQMFLVLVPVHWRGSR